MPYEGFSLANIMGLAQSAANIYQSFAEPAPRGNGGGWDIPWVDLQSPVVTEGTADAQNACAVAQSPWKRGCNGKATAKLHERVNPSTGKLEHFAPVILGKPRLKGQRRRRRCCPR